MFIKKNKITNKINEESGQALVIVLILLMVGSLILSPVLSLINTSLKNARVHDANTNELYAADSGVENALWQIRYDRLDTLFDSPDYSIYDYDTVWSYTLDEALNELTANVSIQNVWIPRNLAVPSPAEAETIIEDNKLVISGASPTESNYKIKISFYPGEGENEQLNIDKIGIWLPLGFSYVTGSSNLESDPFDDYYSVPVVQDYAGGQAITWNFSSVPFSDFPGVNIDDVPMVTDITFEYTAAQPSENPAAISWIETSGVGDVAFSWDIDTKIFRIVSVAGDTEIQAYTSKCELRDISSAIAGDYRAVGNSLMIDTDHDYYEIRDVLLNESDAEVTDIPEDAEVVAGYLYWSGWFDGGSTFQTIWEDNCSDFDEWDNGDAWNISYGHFRGHYSDYYDSERRLEMTNTLDLSSYGSGEVEISWDQWENGSLESSDGLEFQFSRDGGESWSNLEPAFYNDIGSSPRHFTYTIPGYYLTTEFKFRFYLDGFSGGDEFCYLDNFSIASEEIMADTSVVFKINGNQVYIDGEGNPQEGAVELTATDHAVLENQPDEFSYACHRDVTRLLKEYSNLGDGENHTGNGQYTVGGVDADTGEHWSYAGWSIVIIYSSPMTVGHQLFLYDTFAFCGGNENLDFDNDGEGGGTISGFAIPDPIAGEDNAAQLTCFVGEGDDCWNGDYLALNGTMLSDGDGSITDVWDSQSVGMSEDGVDIDTFNVTWASGLLETGDTSAQLDMWSDNDNWNLIYMILSIRSETRVGNLSHYIINQ